MALGVASRIRNPAFRDTSVELNRREFWGTPPWIEGPINTTPRLPSISIGVAVGRPDPRQSETRMADGRLSLRLLVVLALTEPSLGDPV